MKRDKKRKRKGKKSNYQNRLSLFQRPDIRFNRSCPLSVKDAPSIDYKNIKLLKKYISDTRKILSSRITSVCQNKQRKLSSAIKKAKILGLV
jgi:small subunit ribosomal protein S18